MMPGKGEAAMCESIDRVRARYFGDAKPVFLTLFDPQGLRILDLGCGGGHNGEMLKRAGARWVGGVERDSRACAQARGET